MNRAILVICAVALVSSAPATADDLRDPRCNSAARYEAMRDGANCSGSEAWTEARAAAPEFRCNGTGAVPTGPVPTDPGSTLPTMEWTGRWMAASVHCGDLVDPRHEAGYCYALGACGSRHVRLTHYQPRLTGGSRR